jgi:DNA-directed RNA polymerase specialized sigma24 family protein
VGREIGGSTEGAAALDAEGQGPPPAEPRASHPRPTVPIHTRAFLEQLVRREAHRLFRRSESLCRSMSIADYAEDAVQQTLIRLLARGRPIDDTGPDSALRYAMRVLRCVCVDECERRARRRIAPQPWDEGPAAAGDGLLGRLASGIGPDLAAVVDARRGARAALLCFEYLPVYAAPSHPSAGRNVAAFWLACVEGMGDDEIARALDIDKANRTMRARGRRHLLGWLCALCGQGEQPPVGDNPTYQAAWQVGFEAGRAFARQHPEWWPSRPGEAEGMSDGE